MTPNCWVQQQHHVYLVGSQPSETVLGRCLLADQERALLAVLQQCCRIQHQCCHLRAFLVRCSGDRHILCSTSHKPDTWACLRSTVKRRIDVSICGIFSNAVEVSGASLPRGGGTGGTRMYELHLTTRSEAALHNIATSIAYCSLNGVRGLLFY